MAITEDLWADLSQNELARFLPGLEIPDPKQAPPLRWGIIGCGGIAEVFARDVPAYSTGRVVAAAARELPRAQKFARRHGIELAFGSYSELLASTEVDAVYIATPHSHHYEQAAAAIRAGKPVLVEKSFTANAAQAASLAYLAQRRGVFVMEAMWTRFLPHQLVVRALVAGGHLGLVRQVRADHWQRLTGIPRLELPELAGGAQLDLGVYPVSFVHSLLGVPSQVLAAGALTETGVDEAVAAIFQYPKALATVSAGMRARSATSAEIVGEDGRIELPDEFYRPGLLRFIRRNGANGEEAPIEWDGTVPGGFQYQAAEVARCLAAGKIESSTMPLATSLEVMEMQDQMLAAVGGQ